MKIRMQRRKPRELTAGKTEKIVKKSALTFFKPDVKSKRNPLITVHITMNCRRLLSFVISARLSKNSGSSTRKKSNTNHLI